MFSHGENQDQVPLSTFLSHCHWDLLVLAGSPQQYTLCLHQFGIFTAAYDGALFSFQNLIYRFLNTHLCALLCIFLSCPAILPSFLKTIFPQGEKRITFSNFPTQTAPKILQGLWVVTPAPLSSLDEDAKSFIPFISPDTHFSQCPHPVHWLPGCHGEFTALSKEHCMT